MKLVRMFTMKVDAITYATLLVLAGSATAAESVDYLRDVKPILSERCYSCHGAVRQKASLRLDTAALIKRGGRVARPSNLASATRAC